MAFVCVLDASDVDCDTFKNGDAWTVAFRIGADKELNLNYFAQVGLEIRGGGGLEYYFNIVKVDGDDSSEHTYWSGKETSSFIIVSDRERILNAICRATVWILSCAQPQEVYRITYDEHPTEKSLKKHELICEAFRQAGYQVVRGDPYGDKRIWWAHRLAGEPASTNPTLDDGEEGQYTMTGGHGRVRL